MKCDADGTKMMCIDTRRRAGGKSKRRIYRCEVCGAKLTTIEVREDHLESYTPDTKRVRQQIDKLVAAFGEFIETTDHLD